MSAVLSLCAVGLSYAGLTALGAAMDRHHRQLRPGIALPGPRRRQVLRFSGAALLAAALWACVLAWGASIGAAVWWGWLCAAAALLAWALSYAPQWGLRVAVSCAVLGLVALTGIAGR